MRGLRSAGPEFMSPCMSLPATGERYDLRSKKGSNVEKRGRVRHAQDGAPTITKRPCVAHDKSCDMTATLPDDLLLIVFKELEYLELSCVSRVSKRFKDISNTESIWRTLFVNRWGEPSYITERAASIAGSWRELYGSKHLSEKLGAPWVEPAQAERRAIVEEMCDSVFRVKYEKASELEIVFLLDGSGSVTDDDFQAMTAFLRHCGDIVLSRTPSAKLGIVQFSNELRVERELTGTNALEWSASVGALMRMNGGTNIAAPIRKAEKMFKGCSDSGASKARVVALLTDGRVDAYQAREAVERAAQMTDEIDNVEIYAFGIGRGVDKQELTRIITASTPQASCEYDAAMNRYMALRILEDNDEW